MVPTISLNALGNNRFSYLFLICLFPVSSPANIAAFSVKFRFFLTIPPPLSLMAQKNKVFLAFPVGL